MAGWWSSAGCLLLCRMFNFTFGNSFDQATCVILTSRRDLFQAQDALEVTNLLLVSLKGLNAGVVMGVFTLVKMEAVVFFSPRVSQGSLYFPGHYHVVLHTPMAFQHCGVSHQPGPCLSK